MASDVEIAWAAGIIEGEGCFIKIKDKRSNYVSCRIQVEMKDKDIIDRLEAIFPGNGKIYPTKNNKYKDYVGYRWKVHKHSSTFDVLIKIMPYLGERRLAKAKELFEYLEPKICK